MEKNRTPTALFHFISTIDLKSSLSQIKFYDYTTILLHVSNDKKPQTSFLYDARNDLHQNIDSPSHELATNKYEDKHSC